MPSFRCSSGIPSSRRREIWRAGMLVIAVGLCTFQPRGAQALITGGTGNDPIGDPGWPPGAAAVFNVPERVAWWEGPPFGGGQWHGEFRGNAEALSRVLADFARIDADKKRIVVHDGTGRSFWLNPNREPDKEADDRIDWVFVIWQIENWQRLRQMPADLRPRDINEDDSPVPQIDVYAGGNMRWADVKVPEGIEVVDERLEAHGFSIEDGTVLEGTVIDLGTQAPLQALVRLETIESLPQGGYQYSEAASAETDAQGRWVLKHAPAGWHRLVARADGFVPRVAGYAQFDDSPRWHSYSTGLSRPAVVSGRVVDADGKPLADVDVNLHSVVAEPGGPYESPDGYEVTTDGEGRFEAGQVPRGTASVWVRKEGYCRPGLGLEIKMPAAGVSLTMVRSATILVTVDFSDTKRPDGYIIEIEPEEGAVVGSWGGSGNITPEGTIKFENVPPGTYILTGRPNPGNEQQQTEPIIIELAGGEEWAATLKAK